MLYVLALNVRTYCVLYVLALYALTYCMLYILALNLHTYCVLYVLALNNSSKPCVATYPSYLCRIREWG